MPRQNKPSRRAEEWAGTEVEVIPNLLSSESVKFPLEDIKKVGDVVLVEEENFVQDEFRAVGLETLNYLSDPGSPQLQKTDDPLVNCENLGIDNKGKASDANMKEVTHRVFFDVEIDGKSAENWT